MRDNAAIKKMLLWKSTVIRLEKTFPFPHTTIQLIFTLNLFMQSIIINSLYFVEFNNIL